MDEAHESLEDILNKRRKMANRLQDAIAGREDPGLHPGGPAPDEEDEPTPQATSDLHPPSATPLSSPSRTTGPAIFDEGLPSMKRAPKGDDTFPEPVDPSKGDDSFPEGPGSVKGDDSFPDVSGPIKGDDLFPEPTSVPTDDGFLPEAEPDSSATDDGFLPEAEPDSSATDDGFLPEAEEEPEPLEEEPEPVEEEPEPLPILGPEPVEEEPEPITLPFHDDEERVIPSREPVEAPSEEEPVSEPSEPSLRAVPLEEPPTRFEPETIPEPVHTGVSNLEKEVRSLSESLDGLLRDRQRFPNSEVFYNVLNEASNGLKDSLDLLR